MKRAKGVTWEYWVVSTVGHVVQQYTSLRDARNRVRNMMHVRIFKCRIVR